MPKNWEVDKYKVLFIIKEKNMINIQITDPHIISTHRQPKSLEDRGSEKSVNFGATMKKNGINTSKPAEINFCGFAPFAESSKFYKSSNVKKVLEFAAEKQLVFGAAFALILTCIFRPAATMALPGKKNKDDKKYASAHSIASGVIGFVISSILFTPISNGIKKLSHGLKENPLKYIKNKDSYLLQDGKKTLDIALTYVDRLPDIVSSVPKGILTVALIPPILKYVFKMEKKGSKTKAKPPVTPAYSLLNFKSNASKTAFADLVGGDQ